ncbi:MAG: RNA methyltransferase [Dermatophilaceae bacterium]
MTRAPGPAERGDATATGSPAEHARAASPKDRFVTVYGRQPVHEALANPAVTVDKVLLAQSARGSHVSALLAAAAARGVPVVRVSTERVKKIAGNGKQDQGVCADVLAPRMRALDAALTEGLHGPVLVLDGVTTPANVGMILRTATAAGFAGVVVPRRGVASLDPLVVKASAGIAFVAPILRCPTAAQAVDALTSSGYRVAGLAADAPESLFDTYLPDDTAYVLGGETDGVGDQVRAGVHTWLRVPLATGVESLNVSAAAAVVCFEVVRRRLA